MKTTVNGEAVQAMPFRIRGRVGQAEDPGGEFDGQWCWQIFVLEGPDKDSKPFLEINSHELANQIKAFPTEELAKRALEENVQEVGKLIGEALGADLAGFFNMKEGGKFQHSVIQKPHQ
jgi:hypothetical protein